MAEQDWLNVARRVHLLGGIRAINNPGPKVIVIPGSDKKQPIEYSIPHYKGLLASLIAQQIVPIGVEYYEFPEQLKGYFPPKWRPVHFGYSTIYPTAEAEDLWSCLANAGLEGNNLEFADVCRRITFEIRASSWRLQDVSNSYETELRALCEQNKFSRGRRFKSLNSFFVFLSTHSFLVDICTLRDYVAEFVSAFLLSGFFSNRITSMSALRRVLPPVKDQNKIASELLDITDRSGQNGWLAKLGAYRDLVVHSTPLVESMHIGMMVQRYLRMGDRFEIPSVYFPIPANPFKVESVRSKGVAYNTVEEWIEDSIKHDPEKASSPDALDYCADVLGKMVSLILRIGKESPIKPKRFTLTEKDIIGPIRQN